MRWFCIKTYFICTFKSFCFLLAIHNRLIYTFELFQIQSYKYKLYNIYTLQYSYYFTDAYNNVNKLIK